MTKHIVGVLATVALLGSGAGFAGGDKQHKAQSTQQMGKDATGGSGNQQAQPPSASDPAMQGQAMQGQALGEKQISGTVLKSSGSELTLRTESGVIAVKINKDTKFQDATLKRARDLKEGQQVRTSFTVDKDGNVAKTIMLDSGMGGSGLDTDPGINQGLDTQGMDRQGMEPSNVPAGHQDLNQGMAPGSDVNAPGTKTY